MTDHVDEGWVCPKCGAVMAPFMVECVNNKRHDKTADSSVVTVKEGEGR